MIQLDLNIKWAIREWSSQGILEKVSAEQKAGWHQFHLQCLGSEVDRMKGDWEWLCEEKNHQKKGGWKNRRKVSVKLEGERQRIFCLEGPEQMAQTGWVAECSCALPCLQILAGNIRELSSLCLCTGTGGKPSAAVSSCGQLVCCSQSTQSSCWSWGQNKGTERGNFPLTHLDCGNEGTQEWRKITFQVYSTILVKKAFLFCCHEGDK